MTPTRPDLDAIKARGLWPGTTTILLLAEERDALVAWVEECEQAIRDAVDLDTLYRAKLLYPLLPPPAPR